MKGGILGSLRERGSMALTLVRPEGPEREGVRSPEAPTAETILRSFSGGWKGGSEVKSTGFWLFFQRS